MEKGRVYHPFFRASLGQEEEAAKQALEVLKILEDQGLGSKKFFGGESINAVDLSFGLFAHWFECMEDAVGIKIMEPINLPRLHSWLENFKEMPVIKENLPNKEKLMEFNKKVRASLLAH